MEFKWIDRFGIYLFKYINGIYVINSKEGLVNHIQAD